MKNGLIDSAAQATTPDDRRIYGVVLAEVIANCDHKATGRVQLRLPWMPGYEPWARVASVMAGKNRGAFAMPKVGDEVLVAFNHGDVREPFIVGSLWNATDAPPAEAANDPDNKWIMRTRAGHEIMFDDDPKGGSIQIRTGTKQRVTLTNKKVEISVDDGDTTAITLDDKGNITVKAKDTLRLEGKTVQIQARTKVEIRGSSAVDLNGGSQCTIDAARIDIG